MISRLTLINYKKGFSLLLINLVNIKTKCKERGYIQLPTVYYDSPCQELSAEFQGFLSQIMIPAELIQYHAFWCFWFLTLERYCNWSHWWALFCSYRRTRIKKKNYCSRKIKRSIRKYSSLVRFSPDFTNVTNPGTTSLTNPLNLWSSGVQTCAPYLVAEVHLAHLVF